MGSPDLRNRGRDRAVRIVKTMDLVKTRYGLHQPSLTLGRLNQARPFLLECRVIKD